MIRREVALMKMALGLSDEQEAAMGTWLETHENGLHGQIGYRLLTVGSPR